MTALQPSACSTCGQPLTEFCTHTLAVLAALTADPRELRPFDAITEGAARLLADIDATVPGPPRRQCPTAVRNIVRRADI